VADLELSTVQWRKAETKVSVHSSHHTPPESSGSGGSLWQEYASGRDADPSNLVPGSDNLTKCVFPMVLATKRGRC